MVETVLSRGSNRCAQPVLLPHELVAAIWAAAGKEAFETLFLGESGRRGLEEFWRRSRREPWFERHPHQSWLRDNPTSCIPVRVHGDDAPVRKGCSILVIQSTAWFADKRLCLVRASLGPGQKTLLERQALRRTP